MNLNTILTDVCELRGQNPEDVKSKSRKQSLTQARQLGMVFSKIYGIASTHKISEFYGSREHATVYQALKSVESWCKSDKQFKADYDKLADKYGPHRYKGKRRYKRAMKENPVDIKFIESMGLITQKSLQP